MYVPSPNHFRKAVTSGDWPGIGGGVPRPYSLPSDQPRPSSMAVQPAFDLFGRMPNHPVLPDTAEIEKLMSRGERPGVLTFFRPANRAGSGRADALAGNKPGEKMLLLSPARYSVWHAHQLRSNDVRLGFRQVKPTRARTPSLLHGS